MGILPVAADRDGIWIRIGLFFLVLGTFAVLYYGYDLKYPHHFVGDMYGIEVLFRLSVLCLTAGSMLLGGVILAVGRRKKIRRLIRVGTLVVAASSFVLVAMAGGVSHSRYMDEVRKTYSEKSVEDLLAIAKGQKDRHALDQLMIRADPRAVPGLVSILVDETQPGNLRYVSAEALGRIGGDEARSALEQARDSSMDEHLKQSLNRMIQDMRAPR